MSTVAQPRRRPSSSSGGRGRGAAAAARKRRASRRRRVVAVVLVLLLGAGGLAVTTPWVEDAVQEVVLPLRHEDVIRQQARDKDLDPSLIAGVIFTESRFSDATSEAGAKGLMQIMPATAEYIADKSGGTAFVQGDLSTPQVNISYGSWYLRYLLERYGGNEALALAAYNAGEGKVDEWIAEGRDVDGVSDIPFPETREYVGRVLDARVDYRERYPRELGL